MESIQFLIRFYHTEYFGKFLFPGVCYCALIHRTLPTLFAFLLIFTKEALRVGVRATLSEKKLHQVGACEKIDAQKARIHSSGLSGTVRDTSLDLSK
jgi:hypothetical protein